MKITKTVINTVEGMRPELTRRLGEYSRHVDDVIQDVFITLIEIKPPKSEDYVGFTKITARNHVTNYVRDERNRRRLEHENSELIVRNTTPTLSGNSAGGPEDFAATEEQLRVRWVTLSPFLRRVAKRSFFGYEETAEKVAEEEGTTVAAINMARTRIKKHMNGVRNDREA